MDWNAHFRAKGNGSNMGTESVNDIKTPAQPTTTPVAVSVKPKWYDVRHWSLGDWGSAASIVGIGLWLKDQFKR